VHHRVDQPDVRARPELEVALRQLRQPDLARVGDDEGGAAFFIRSASTGCASVVFEPMTRMKRAFSISGIELVVAPLPNDLTRP
jgi:hypothetical protein